MIPSLPRSSKGEDLETISKNKLGAIFDTRYFELRPEIQRDKGVDVIVEIKKDGCYTNFRFAIQLKATNKSESSNSVSYQIEVSNINYLLNYGMPAYYILYDNKRDKFYIEQVQSVYSSLIRKYPTLKLPKKYSVEFSHEMTADSIDVIYQDTLKAGMLLKNLNALLYPVMPKTDFQAGVLIDEENEVYSVEQNIQFINQYGFQLLNMSAFKRIIEIEQRTHPRTKASAMFNLICGIAYHQQYNLYKAIEFLKIADSQSIEFDNQTKLLLKDSLLHVKYLLGMIDEATFNTQIADLMQNDDLSSFLALQKAQKEFLQNKGNDNERLDVLYEKTNEILNSEADNIKGKIMGYANILQAEEKVLVNDLSKNLVLICGKVQKPQETKTYKSWISFEDTHYKRLKALIEYVRKQEDFLSLCNLTMDGIRWVYSKTFLTHIFQCWNKSTFTVEGKLSKEDIDNLLIHAGKIDSIVKSYDLLGHKENLVTSLFNKYEILLFAGSFEDAQTTATRISELIDHNEFNGLRKDFAFLQNGGTLYERYLKSFQDRMHDIYDFIKSTDLKEYFEQDIEDDMLPFVERNVKWSITDFYEMRFD